MSTIVVGHARIWKNRIWPTKSEFGQFVFVTAFGQFWCFSVLSKFSVVVVVIVFVACCWCLLLPLVVTALLLPPCCCRPVVAAQLLPPCCCPLLFYFLYICCFFIFLFSFAFSVVKNTRHNTVYTSHCTPCPLTFVR